MKLAFMNIQYTCILPSYKDRFIVSLKEEPISESNQRSLKGIILIGINFWKHPCYVTPHTTSVQTKL
jgi:hypothetical protein